MGRYILSWSKLNGQFTFVSIWSRLDMRLKDKSIVRKNKHNPQPCLHQNPNKFCMHLPHFEDEETGSKVFKWLVSSYTPIQGKPLSPSLTSWFFSLVAPSQLLTKTLSFHSPRKLNANFPRVCLWFSSSQSTQSHQLIPITSIASIPMILQ